jgi:hypothetical protein
MIGEPLTAFNEELGAHDTRNHKFCDSDHCIDME